MSRKIDAEVAEKVFGLTVTSDTHAAPYTIDFGIGKGGWDGPLPEYSTDITAAGSVLSKLTELGYGVTLYITSPKDLCLNVEYDAEEICRAALKAVRGGEEV